MFRKFISIILSLSFLFQQTGFAQAAVVELNLAAHIGHLMPTGVIDKFRPPHLRYFSYDSLTDNFKILLDKGDEQKGLSPKGTVPERRVQELLNYFLIGITIPNDAFWVNLRPDSPDQIIDERLSQTDIGKIMLEADLQLKKDTAGMTSPATAEGKLYWDKLYKKASELYGNEPANIPTLTRPWIVPAEVIIRETAEGSQVTGYRLQVTGQASQVNPSAYIYKATLKVMLEQDYFSSEGTVARGEGAIDYTFKDERAKELNEYSTQLIKELIIPKLTKEVNTSKRYAALRQVFYSLILARWFKVRFGQSSEGLVVRGEGSFVKRINTQDLTNLTSKESWSKDTYFKAYQDSFKNGEYKLQETVYTPTGQVIRSYFSGGIAATAKELTITTDAGSPITGLIASNRGNDVILESLSSKMLPFSGNGSAAVFFAPVVYPVVSSPVRMSERDLFLLRENEKKLKREKEERLGEALIKYITSANLKDVLSRKEQPRRTEEYIFQTNINRGYTKMVLVRPVRLESPYAELKYQITLQNNYKPMWDHSDQYEITVYPDHWIPKVSVKLTLSTGSYINPEKLAFELAEVLGLITSTIGAPVKSVDSMNNAAESPISSGSPVTDQDFKAKVQQELIQPLEEAFDSLRQALLVGEQKEEVVLNFLENIEDGINELRKELQGRKEATNFFGRVLAKINELSGSKQKMPFNRTLYINNAQNTVFGDILMAVYRHEGTEGFKTRSDTYKQACRTFEDAVVDIWHKGYQDIEAFVVARELLEKKEVIDEQDETNAVRTLVEAAAKRIVSEREEIVSRIISVYLDEYGSTIDDHIYRVPNLTAILGRPEKLEDILTFIEYSKKQHSISPFYAINVFRDFSLSITQMEEVLNSDDFKAATKEIEEREYERRGEIFRDLIKAKAAALEAKAVGSPIGRNVLPEKGIQDLYAWLENGLNTEGDVALSNPKRVLDILNRYIIEVLQTQQVRFEERRPIAIGMLRFTASILRGGSANQFEIQSLLEKAGIASYSDTSDLILKSSSRIKELLQGSPYHLHKTDLDGIAGVLDGAAYRLEEESLQSGSPMTADGLSIPDKGSQSQLQDFALKKVKSFDELVNFLKSIQAVYKDGVYSSYLGALINALLVQSKDFYEQSFVQEEELWKKELELVAALLNRYFTRLNYQRGDKRAVQFANSRQEAIKSIRLLIQSLPNIIPTYQNRDQQDIVREKLENLGTVIKNAGGELDEVRTAQQLVGLVTTLKWLKSEASSSSAAQKTNIDTVIAEIENALTDWTREISDIFRNGYQREHYIAFFAPQIDQAYQSLGIFKELVKSLPFNTETLKTIDEFLKTIGVYPRNFAVKLESLSLDERTYRAMEVSMNEANDAFLSRLVEINKKLAELSVGYAIELEQEITSPAELIDESNAGSPIMRKFFRNRFKAFIAWIEGINGKEMPDLKTDGNDAGSLISTDKYGESEETWDQIAPALQGYKIINMEVVRNGKTTDDDRVQFEMVAPADGLGGPISQKIEAIGTSYRWATDRLYFAARDERRNIYPGTEKFKSLFRDIAQRNDKHFKPITASVSSSVSNQEKLSEAQQVINQMEDMLRNVITRVKALSPNVPFTVGDLEHVLEQVNAWKELLEPESLKIILEELKGEIELMESIPNDERLKKYSLSLPRDAAIKIQDLVRESIIELKELLNSLQDLLGKASDSAVEGASPVVPQTDTPDAIGGIDFGDKFQPMPFKIEPLGNFQGLSYKLPELSSSALLDFDLDKYAKETEAMLEAGMLPSASSVIEYIAICRYKGEFEARRKDVVRWLAEMGILEEMDCCESSVDFRQALVLVDSV